MRETIIIPVMELVLEENGRVAERTKQVFNAKSIFMINIMGAPGAGKTTCLVNIIEQLNEKNVSVIEGDIESDIDTRMLWSLGVDTQQVNTQGACHLDAPAINKAVETLELKDNSVLFIENVGNLVCPAEFNLGEHIRILVLSVADGSDKPYKYPLAFEKSDAFILNKCDLLPYVDFDEEFFLRGVRALNKKAPVFKVSGRNKQGFLEVIKWIEQKRAEVNRL
jgi:hydrogenase nickel incorporation protein HypB